jgi:hypothetical protein
VKKFRILFVVFVVIFTGACASSATYNINKYVESNDNNLTIVDERLPSDTKYHEGCKMLREPIDNIGDENIKPSKLSLLKSSLFKVGISGKTVTIDKFNLKLIYPRQCGVGRGAIMASLSIPAGIIMQSGSDEYVEDGVLCELSMRIEGKELKGYSYVPAGDGIRTLFGPSVGTTKLEEPLSKATEQCVEYAVQSL